MGKGLNSVLWDSTLTRPTPSMNIPFSRSRGEISTHTSFRYLTRVFLIFLLLYLCKYWGIAQIEREMDNVRSCRASLVLCPPINTWDVLIYAPITIVIATLIILGCSKTGAEHIIMGPSDRDPSRFHSHLSPLLPDASDMYRWNRNRKDAIRSLPVPARKRLVHCHLSAPSHQRHTEATVSFAHRCAIHPCR